jgi:dynein heavy chain
MVVNVEKNELEMQKQELVKKQNELQVILDELESSLLKELSEADPATILDNKELINNLEKTKLTAISIQEQAGEAKKTEENINAQREIYRPVASEGAMLYFLCISLCIIDHMYQYSLESFIKFFFKAIERTQEKDETRTLKLIDNIRYTIYQWISRGLFEKHKLIFLTMITFRLMQK